MLVTAVQCATGRHQFVLFPTLKWENGQFPLVNSPLGHSPKLCSVRVRVRSGVSRVRVRFIVWVRGKCPGGISDTLKMLRSVAAARVICLRQNSYSPSTNFVI